MLTKRLVVALGAVTVMAAGCGGSDAGGGGDSRFNLVSPGTLTVCSDIPYAPMEMETDSGYTGFDIELMREIAKGLNLELDVKDVGFSGIQSGATLAAGTCDVGASSLSITDQRAKNLDFSNSYYKVDQSILVPKGSPIEGIEDLAGKKVGVQGSTTGADYARANAPESAKIINYPSDAELYTALKAGNIDAMLQDFPANFQHAQEDAGKVELVAKYKSKDNYGFAVAEEGHNKLLKAINSQLAKLRKDGTYDKLSEKFLSAPGAGGSESS